MWVANTLHQFVLRHPTLAHAPTVWIALLSSSLWPPMSILQPPNEQNKTVPFTCSQRRRFSKLLKQSLAPPRFNAGIRSTSCAVRTLSVSDKKATSRPLRQRLFNAQTSEPLRPSMYAFYVFSVAPPCSATPIAPLSCHQTQAKIERGTRRTCVCDLSLSLLIHCNATKVLPCASRPLTKSVRNRAAHFSTARCRQQNPVARPLGVSFNASPNGSSSSSSNARISWGQYESDHLGLIRKHLNHSLPLRLSWHRHSSRKDHSTERNRQRSTKLKAKAKSIGPFTISLATYESSRSPRIMFPTSRFDSCRRRVCCRLTPTKRSP